MLSWRIAEQLSSHGHDVAALSGDDVREDLDDPAVLVLAASEGRALVSCNLDHLLSIDREWRSKGKEHAGIVLVPPSLPNSAIGEIVKALEALLAAHPEQAALRGMVAWLPRAQH